MNADSAVINKLEFYFQLSLYREFLFVITTAQIFEV